MKRVIQSKVYLGTVIWHVQADLSSCCCCHGLPSPSLVVSSYRSSSNNGLLICLVLSIQQVMEDINSWRDGRQSVSRSDTTTNWVRWSMHAVNNNSIWLYWLLTFSWLFLPPATFVDASLVVGRDASGRWATDHHLGSVFTIMVNRALTACPK
jgi:hypothetical protein